MSLFGLLGAVSCAQVEEKLREAPQPPKNTQPLNSDSGLFQSDFKLFTVIEAIKPIADHTYILAKRDDVELIIRDTEGFAQVIGDITSKEEALELVRLLTSQEIRPFLQDIYYAEVHKKADTDDIWFAIEPEQYDEWNLHEPVIIEENGIYQIDRFVACYPRLIHRKIITEAKLIHIREWVSPEGDYLAEIRDILAEGDEIRNILVFTK